MIEALAAEGFSLAGARLLYLPAQLGSSALLGLDSPLASGPLLAVLVEGFDPTERLQALAGAADPKIARTTDVGSWRARLGIDRTKNVLSTPRHAKGAQRATSFFFGPRPAAGGRWSASPAAPLVLRQPRDLLLLVSRAEPAPAPAACALLLKMQRAGLTLHRALCLDKRGRDALGVDVACGAASCLLFLLSREGQPLAFATSALGAEANELLSLQECPVEVASTVLTKAGPAPCPLGDMFKYTTWMLKNDLCAPWKP